jgi:branched-chain amino acid transport system permease protein
MGSGKKRIFTWVILVVIVGLFPHLGVETYTIQILTLAGIYAIVALGLNLVLGNAGQISLGQAAFFGIGAYTTAQFMIKFGISFWLVLPIAGLLAGFLGVGLGYLALRFHGHYLALVTLCFGLITQILFREFPAITAGAAGISDIPSPKFFGQLVDNSSQTWVKTFHLAWFLFLALAWLLNNLISLHTGRALAALRDNSVAAEAAGVPIEKYKIQAFTISAVLAGFAGGVYCINIHYIGPEIFGVGASLEFLIMVVIGGLGSPIGAVVGAILLAVMPEFLRGYEEYRLFFFALMLMIIVLVAPGGIWGIISKGFKSIFRAQRYIIKSHT